MGKTIPLVYSFNAQATAVCTVQMIYYCTQTEGNLKTHIQKG